MYPMRWKGHYRNAAPLAACTGVQIDHAYKLYSVRPICKTINELEATAIRREKPGIQN